MPLARRRLLLSLSLLVLALVPSAARARPAAAQSKPAAEDPRPTVAVLYFDYSGRDAGLEPLRKGLAQMLISDLSDADDVRIVERERLEAVLAEQKLTSSAKFDQRTVARIGKLLGARYLVLGSYFDVLKSLRVDARIVAVETGQVVKSLGANGKPDDFLGLEQAVASGLKEALAQLPQVITPTGPAGPVRAKTPAPKPPKQLKTGTALAYGKALAALDAGQKKDARVLLTAVLKEQPDFALAARDLDRLIQ